MKRRETSSTGTVSGLRTRYRPRTRIGQGVVAMAPWVDIVLVVVLFAILDSKLVLQPGVVVELPKAPFTGGTQLGLVAVIMSVGSGEPGKRDEIVYFDDERYMAGSEEQLRDLREAMTGRARRRPGSSLVIQADKNVQHGTIVDIMNKALEAGFKDVNIGTRQF